MLTHCPRKLRRERLKIGLQDQDAAERAHKARDPAWRARRWVVEACHSWLNRNRGVLIRWSKKEDNHLALLQLACG